MLRSYSETIWLSTVSGLGFYLSVSFSLVISENDASGVVENGTSTRGR